MDCRAVWKRGISLLLVWLLLLTPVVRVSAEEFPEDGEQNILTVQEETEASEETETPEKIEDPDETETPEETEDPDETETPEETEDPDETETPEETEDPDETETPEETEDPDEAETPEETEASGETGIPEETEAPEETQTPEETEVPEASEPPVKLMRAALWSMPPVRTIAEVLELHASEDILITEGTVVLAGETQAVLQDTTGGIRLAFLSPPEITPGDILQVAGHRTDSGFTVSDYTKNGTGALPAVESTLAEGREAIRILLKVPFWERTA